MRRGRSGGAKLLSLRWQATRRGQVRVGIVVSKRVGKAVVRNLVRRRLREALRSLLLDEEVSVRHRGAASFDLVVIARPEAAGASFWQLKDALRRALERGKLL
ncbi:MAG: ribonuclease P protein component [Trueperaceae bacterium]|nr:MAG: ribonuclease P protein component [Trueperaceae bacterium]